MDADPQAVQIMIALGWMLLFVMGFNGGNQR